MSAAGTSSRFEYEEVFGCKGEQESLGKKSVTNEQQRSRLQNRVSNCITPISVNDSNSDSDSDAELESRKTSRSRCFQMSSTSFEQTNPISKIFQPEKKARSVSFDGRCLPMPQLFDRRGRSQSVSQVHQSRKSSDISEAVLQENSDDGGCSQSSCPAKTIPQPQNAEELDVTQQSIASTPYTFSNAFDYTRCVGFNAISFNSADKFLSTESPRTPKSLFDSSGELQLRDCYGNAREALVLHSHIVARQDQYNAIAPVIRSNEVCILQRCCLITINQSGWYL